MILFRRRGEVRGRRLVMVNFAWLAGREIISSGLRYRLGIFVLGVFGVSLVTASLCESMGIYL